MRIRDWSSGVCSSDLLKPRRCIYTLPLMSSFVPYAPLNVPKVFGEEIWTVDGPEIRMDYGPASMPFPTRMTVVRLRSEEHTSELQSLMRTSYAVFCLKKKTFECST